MKEGKARAERRLSNGLFSSVHRYNMNLCRILYGKGLDYSIVVSAPLMSLCVSLRERVCMHLSAYVSTRMAALALCSFFCVYCYVCVKPIALSLVFCCFTH